ncbi:MAG: hypothetical protein P8188_08365 [Gemmatimonadota bacterium]|jgi:hypothetical protein
MTMVEVLVGVFATACLFALFGLHGGTRSGDCGSCSGHCGSCTLDQEEGS